MVVPTRCTVTAPLVSPTMFALDHVVHRVLGQVGGLDDVRAGERLCGVRVHTPTICDVAGRSSLAALHRGSRTRMSHCCWVFNQRDRGIEHRRHLYATYDRLDM